MRRYLDSLAIFAGTAIGVGIFGLPYATAKLGFFPILIYFIILGGVILILQLAYGEVCLRTNGKHRMPGYAEMYLGKKAKSIILLSNAVGLYGAILAYLIIGGSFLAQLLSPVFGGPTIAYILIFFATGSFIIFLGTNVIAKSEIFSLSIFFIVLTFLIYKGVPHIDTQNFLTLDLKNLFFPYGIILFSIAGLTIIPETREILGDKAKNLKKIIIIGSLIPIITSIIFIYLILGVTGVNTTEDALTGLLNVLGEKTLLAGFLFGIIATFTSYLTIGLTLKKYTTVVYLKISKSGQIEMFKQYLKDPKPVIWGDSFRKSKGESNQAALEKCYPKLLQRRAELYQKYADCTLDVQILNKNNFSLNDFLKEIKIKI
ncbi:amino acid permease [Patescibacteria group bacterium]|nr:amino acid permease [Patescibacteria group bacterium]